MAMTLIRQSARGAMFLAMAGLLTLTGSAANANVVDGTKTVDGLTVYLGVVPAAIVARHSTQHTEAKMHGGVPPSGARAFHIVVAVFNKADGTRLTNLKLLARLQGKGVDRSAIPLTPMTVDGALTFGGYASFGQLDNIMIFIDITRPGRSPRTRTTTLLFEYEPD